MRCANSIQTSASIRSGIICETAGSGIPGCGSTTCCSAPISRSACVTPGWIGRFVDSPMPAITRQCGSSWRSRVRLRRDGDAPSWFDRLTMRAAGNAGKRRLVLVTLGDVVLGVELQVVLLAIGADRVIHFPVVVVIPLDLVPGGEAFGGQYALDFRAFVVGRRTIIGEGGCGAKAQAESCGCKQEFRFHNGSPLQVSTIRE